MFFRTYVWLALAVPVLGICLFGDCTALKYTRVLAPALAEIAAVLGEPGTQWLVFLCAGVYLLGFASLRRRLAGGNKVSECGGLRVEGRTGSTQAGWGLAAQWPGEPAFWLAGLMVLAALAYAVDYTEAAKSTQALTFVGAAMVGEAAGFFQSRKQKTENRNGGRERQKLKTEMLKADRGSGECGATVLVLMVLLAGAALWQGETGHLFQYRGQARWSGPWDNPNTFGVLMGVGFVLAVGKLVQSLKSKVQSLEPQGEGSEAKVQSLKSRCQGPGAEVQRPKSKVQSRSRGEGRGARDEGSEWKSCALRWFRGCFFLAAAVVMGVGLLKSYSRGAWVGTAVGLGVVAVGSLKSKVRSQSSAECGVRNAEYRSANADPQRSTLNSQPLLPAPQPSTLNSHQPFNRAFWLTVLVLSLCVLAFWSFRDTKWLPARRAVSVGNVNDFSWRNRVAAWEGALQMMADKPWFGFGWNQPERVYDSFYRPARLTEGAAIQMNDYFMLGSTLGVPALLCFLMYIGLSLKGSLKSKVQSPKSEVQSSGAEVQSPKPKVQSPESEGGSSYSSIQSPVGAAQEAEGGRPGTQLVREPTLDFRLWTLDFGL